MSAAVVVDVLDGMRLNRALRAGIYRLLTQQDYLNRINVFPVPDGDTGTNLALSMSSVLHALKRWPDQHAGQTLTRVADAALDGARGNSGAILAQFFLGVCDRLGHLGQLGTADFVAGVAGGASYARDSLSDPREGTILSVLTDFASELEHAARQGAPDFVQLLRGGVAAARRSVQHTTEQLEALRKAQVVDAGAQGFFELVAGMLEHLELGADHEPAEPGPLVIEASTELTAGEEQNLEHRYCTECVVMADNVDRRHLREQLATIGSSLVVAGMQHKLRVHVHVNDPAEVFRIAASFGTVSGEKADDMQRQQHAAHTSRRRVAIVTDSAADIPEDELDRLDIHMVPVRVHFGEHSYLDKLSISPEEFFRELERSPVHPKTSQPPPGDFRRHFEFLSSHHESVISVNITRQASGTCAAAETAAKRTTGQGRVTVIDSMNASLGQGLVAMYAAECALAGMDAAAIEAATRAVIPRTRTFGLVGSLDYAVRGGRVPRWVQRAADALQLMPVLHNDRRGRVTAGGVLLGRQALREKFARFVQARMPRGRRCRLLVGHANCESDGQWLLERLQGPNVVYARLLPLGSALGVHGGPGMLVVGLQDYEISP